MLFLNYIYKLGSGWYKTYIDLQAASIKLFQFEDSEKNPQSNRHIDKKKISTIHETNTNKDDKITCVHMRYIFHIC